jgi:poly-gamma-glutamate synthesis protein (capsule biosynthesis protein)
MRGHPAATQRLARAGFTLLNVANNHTMQHGEDAFTETVQSLRQQEIRVVGLASQTRRECVPEFLCVNGVNVTVLAYAFERDKYSDGPVAYAFGPDCDIVQEVKAAKKRSDIVICSVHWGVEFVRHPSMAEETLGHQLVEAGADLILGHHPHVVRRIERVGRGIIAYSLGNFVFDMLWNEWLRVGLVLRVRLSKRGIEDFRTELVWVGDDYQPRPLVGDQRLLFAEAFRALERRPEWISTEFEYAREYEKLFSNNRYQSYRHFLRHVTDRPFTYTLQTVLRTSMRKAGRAFT